MQQGLTQRARWHVAGHGKAANGEALAGDPPAWPRAGTAPR